MLAFLLFFLFLTPTFFEEKFIKKHTGSDGKQADQKSKRVDLVFIDFLCLLLDGVSDQLEVCLGKRNDQRIEGEYHGRKRKEHISVFCYSAVASQVAG